MSVVSADIIIPGPELRCIVNQSVGMSKHRRLIPNYVTIKRVEDLRINSVFISTGPVANGE